MAGSKGFFSFLKFIKTNQRTCFKEDTFDYLMKVNAEVPLLKNEILVVLLNCGAK